MPFHGTGFFVRLLHSSKDDILDFRPVNVFQHRKRKGTEKLGRGGLDIGGWLFVI